MLTDELSRALRAHAQDVNPQGRDILAGLDAKLSRRRRHGVAVGAMVVAVTAIVGISTVAARLVESPAASGHSRQGPTSVGSLPAPGPARCDTPTRTVAHYLDWSCPTGTIDGQGQQVLARMLGAAKQSIGFQTWRRLPNSSPHPAKAVHMRVLAYGPVTDDAATDRMFAAAEFWLPHRHGAYFVTLVFPKNVRPGTAFMVSLGEGALGRVGDIGNSGQIQTARVLYNTNHVYPTSSADTKTCSSIPATGDNRPAHCSDIFLVRPDIVALRLLRPGVPSVIAAAHNGFAGVPVTGTAPEAHGDWRVQALDRHGKVVSTIGYDTGLEALANLNDRSSLTIARTGR
jgi:hypothetical protein